ncbi:protein SENSITIVE TO PROTON RHIZOTOXICITY 2 [Cannabis sativa]|nr:protein SENSITIVE TO PROTON RHIZOTOXICITY 2 [Cannabis sativa]
MMNNNDNTKLYTNLLSSSPPLDHNHDQINNLSHQMYSNINSNNNNISSSSSSFPPPPRPHDHNQDQYYSSSSNNNNNLNSILYTLSILKQKVHQLQSLAAILLSPPPLGNDNEQSATTSVAGGSSSSSAIASMNMYNTIQDIIAASSSMLLNFHNMGLLSPDIIHNNNNKVMNNINTNTFYSSNDHHHHSTLNNWLGNTNHEIYNNNNTTTNHDDQIMMSTNNTLLFPTTTTLVVKGETSNSTTNIIITKSSKKDHDEDHNDDFDIIELEARDLLAKYTHYCQICGKGFKRDANLRMHMRAHGDQYKTSEALCSNYNNKLSINTTTTNEHWKMSSSNHKKKYSCPEEGCRWNKKHVKFQPLKSMICVKNHYKRSHCPKMYVCKRCSNKQFSVLSDLRTHEKHCGDLNKWQCSCGTTFSRKDKLMGHVALFIGHTPLNHKMINT